jgi:hypothetical protein
MKKQLRKQKLQVKVEKVRTLKDSETTGAQGGAAGVYTQYCWVGSANCNVMTAEGCCLMTTQK